MCVFSIVFQIQGVACLLSIYSVYVSIVCLFMNVCGWVLVCIEMFRYSVVAVCFVIKQCALYVIEFR